MFRNIFWMGASVVARAGTSFALFVLIARYLGPEEYGVYMLWHGLMFLCAVLANFGLGNMLLKEIAQNPESVTDAVGEALSLRLTLGVGILVCAAMAAFFVPRPELMLVLLLAHLIELIAEVFYVAYRAIGRYAHETQLATCASIAQLALVGAAALADLGSVGIAVAFLSGKIVQLVIVLMAARRALGDFFLRSVRASLGLAMRTRAYAVDMVLLSAFGNIDGAMLKLFVGFETVGMYQSGMRLFQGGGLVAPILANVFLPEMARQSLSAGGKPRATIALQAVFLGFGAVFGLTLAYFSEWIVLICFGESFRKAAELLPFFGLLFFVRFFAAGWGVILTAAGHQTYRAKATAIHLALTLSLGSYLTYHLEAKGWLIALLVANVLLGVLFVSRVVRAGLVGKTAAVSSAAAILGCLLFVPRLL